MTTENELEQLAVNTIRILSAEGVEKAGSGHPGLPMGATESAFTVWSKFLKHYPKAPGWPDRDRFVLSAGHGSMLLYTLLYLCGYQLTMEDLKNFRQWGSPTAGHPEYWSPPGVETTSGPLGQGFANAVGMAIAENMMAARFNTDTHKLFDHYTYVLSSDGCIMEGVASEAASLGGHLGLGKLIVLYDDNQITIEGKTSLAFSEDVGMRFKGYNWHVTKADGNSVSEVERAVKEARSERERPSLVICKSHIAYGAPNKQDTAGAHGAPLGEEELARVKERFGFPADKSFYVPEEVSGLFAEYKKKWERDYREWQRLLTSYKKEEPEKAAALETYLSHQQFEALEGKLPSFEPGKPLATRASSGKVINAFATEIPNLVGGSADLAPSNKTLIEGGGDVRRGDFSSRNLHFGVREHCMGAVLNGMALHGGLKVFGGTFLVFADYMRPPLRMAALMGAPVVFVFTHDSIFVGEDGPTHQAVEQMASLRAVPNLDVIRPAEAVETSYAWLHALNRKEGPTALCLSRQKLPTFDSERASRAKGVLKGAYVVESDEDPCDWVLIGTGSEVHLCLEAAELLRKEGKRIRVVSMPSWKIFLRQDEEYRKSVLPEGVRRAVSETGVRMGWDRFAGPDGVYLTLDRFGASAPYKVLAEKFGFTAEKFAEKIKRASA